MGIEGKYEMDYERLMTFRTRMEAEMAAEVLEKAQIPFIIQAEDIGMFGPSSAPPPRGARLLVPREDMQRARGLLKGMFGEGEA
jgi:Putative prokaryotic signal transducing protein